MTRGFVFAWLVFFCLADCLLRALLGKLSTRTPAETLQRWCRRVLSCLRIRVSVVGTVPREGLIVSNHLSYTDILVLSAATRCVFVSKSEIASWPLIGWIARMTGAVFVRRERPSQTNLSQQEMQERLKAGALLLLFPEGTTTDSRELLPFRSPFFEAAVATAAPVWAAYLSYELPHGDGDPIMDICYWDDMTLLPHFLKLLTKAETKAIVCFSDRPRVFSDRKQAAQEMQREVSELAHAVKGMPQIAST